MRSFLVKPLSWCLAVVLLVPTVGRADSIKSTIFTLGVQVGNAEGVLWGLFNSFDTSVKAHPGAPTLMQRLLKDASVTAKILGMPSEGLEKLSKDLIAMNMTFADMSKGLTPLVVEQLGALPAKYPPESVAIFNLGRQLTMTTMFADHPRNFPPQPIPNFKPGIAGNAGIMKGNISTNKLEATISLTDDIAKQVADGTPYASMATFMQATVLPKWTDDFLKAPPFGAAASPVALMIGVSPTLSFGVSTPAGKKLTYNAFGGTNTTVVRIDNQIYSFGSAPGMVAENAKLPGGGSRAVWTIQGLRIVQTLEPVPSRTGGPADTVLIRWNLENPGNAQRNVGLRLQLDTLIGDNDGVPFTVPGQGGLVNTSADFKGNIPDFVQALEVPDLQKPGTIAHATLKMRGRTESPDRVSLTRWPGSTLNWEIPVQNMWYDKSRADSALVLYWSDRPLAPGASREIGFAYGLGTVSGSEGGGNLATTVGGRTEAGHDFTVSSYIKNPVLGEKVTLEVPQGMKVIGSATVDVPAPPAGASTSVVSWKAQAERAGSFQLKIASTRGTTQTQTVQVDASTGTPNIPTVIGNPKEPLLAQGAVDRRGAGTMTFENGNATIAVPAGQVGSAAAFHKDPLRGNFDVEIAYKLDTWQPQAGHFLHMRLMIAAEPNEKSPTLCLIDRSAFGSNNRHGADVFTNGTWSRREVIRVSKDMDGKLRIGRRGNSVEMSYLNNAGQWETLAQFNVTLPEAVHVGVSAGNDIFPRSDSPVRVTISRFDVQPR